MVLEQCLRFCVASRGARLRAASWKLWTPAGKRDVYLAARELGGALKLSLHESGNWHFAYDGEFFEAKVPDAHRKPKGRFIDRWTKPAPLIPGTTLALRLVTPWTALRAGDFPGSKILEVEPPAEGRAREIGIFLVEPPSAVSGWPGKNKMGTKLIGSYRMVGGSTIWAVHWETACPDFSGIDGRPATLFNGISRSDISSDLRAILYGDHEDGSKVVYDLAGTYVPGA